MRRADGLELSPDEVILAARLVAAGVAAAERRNGSASAPAVQLRDQLTGFAREYLRETASVQVDGDRETAKLPAVVIVAGSADTTQVTATAAAERLGVSPQHVRGLCRARALAGVKTGTGWQIEQWSVEERAALRQAEGTR
jgi:hypothetical protein